MVHRKEFPVYLMLRARPRLPSLREENVFPALREALREANGNTFRVLHFSVQTDHIHLIVEANSTAALERGARGTVIRTARAFNKALGRSGPVWGDRYHARPLRTPLEVREALVYVLMSFRKQRPTERLKFDPYSSAPWFDGFDGPARPPADPSPVAIARTWLGSVGWRRHGLLKPPERPRDPQPPDPRPLSG
jgi:putative transposase